MLNSPHGKEQNHTHQILQNSGGLLVLGYKAFASISAVEGMYLSKGMKADFRRLQGSSPSVRRDALTGKYGKK